jgi:hypothetical protein
MRGGLHHLGVPGPCPVDDTPFTACTTTPAATARGSVTTPLRRPRVLDQAVTPPLESEAVTFTTKTYRRELHGPQRTRGMTARPAPPKPKKDSTR